MLTAVIIPASAELHAALRTRGAQQAIDAGFGLYFNGTHAALLPAARPGWHPLAVKLRDLLPIDTQPAPEEAA